VNDVPKGWGKELLELVEENLSVWVNISLLASLASIQVGLVYGCPVPLVPIPTNDVKNFGLSLTVFFQKKKFILINFVIFF